MSAEEVAAKLQSLAEQVPSSTEVRINPADFEALKEARLSIFFGGVTWCYGLKLIADDTVAEGEVEHG